MEVDDRTLFIGNLDKNVSEEILYELFLQAGPIERVSIPTSKNNSYGFVTYKHECSVSYAIELFKGTNLFKKELSIKKRNPKTNINDQQSSDCYKFAISDSTFGRQGLIDFQLHDLQLLAENINANSQPLVNFKPNALKGNWPSRNKPYNFLKKNHFPRPKEIRDRRNSRNYGTKMYHERKNRCRD